MIKISVIITNYNYETYVLDALQSVIDQTMAPYEIIIIDDGSTDTSREKINAFCALNSHVRFIKNDKNLGVTQSINKAVKLSKGNYIALLASDDIYLPHFIEKTVQCIQDFPQVGVVCSRFSYFIEDDKDNIQFHPRCFAPPDTAFLKNFSLIKTMRTYRFWIPSPCVMRKDLFIKFGGYISEFGRYTDFIIYALASFESGVCYIPTTICAVREHHKQFSRNITHKDLHKSWKAVLTTFTSGEYQKYRKTFTQSHLLYLFGVPFFYFLIKNPKFWAVTDFSLWKKLAILWRRKVIDPKLKILIKN